MRERDPERRRLGDDAVGHGQWREPAVDRERVDRDLAAGHELLDEDDARARLVECELERVREHRLVGHEHEPLLALPVGRLDHARVAERAGRRLGVLQRRADDMPRVWHPGFGEALALAELRGREHRGRRVDRVRQHEPFRDPRRDRDRPVDSGRNEAVDPLGGGEPVELRLVLDRDDCATVGAGEPGRRRDRGRPRSRRDRAHVRPGAARAVRLPAPRTRRRAGSSAGFPATSRHSSDTTRRYARGPRRTRCVRATRAAVPPCPWSRCGGRPGRAARRR